MLIRVGDDSRLKHIYPYNLMVLARSSDYYANLSPVVKANNQLDAYNLYAFITECPEQVIGLLLEMLQKRHGLDR